LKRRSLGFCNKSATEDIGGVFIFAGDLICQSVVKDLTASADVAEYGAGPTLLWCRAGRRSWGDPGNGRCRYITWLGTFHYNRRHCCDATVALGPLGGPFIIAIARVTGALGVGTPFR
jgi:hypothetical protein